MNSNGNATFTDKFTGYELDHTTFQTVSRQKSMCSIVTHEVKAEI